MCLTKTKTGNVLFFDVLISIKSVGVNVGVNKHLKMRFLSFMHPNSTNDEEQLTKHNNEIETKNGYSLYDSVLYEKYKLMTYIYDNNKFLQTNYKKFVPISHPFESIKSTVSSNFIPNANLKITNAFMKMWEILLWFDSKNILFPRLSENEIGHNEIGHNEKKMLTMYDVAGAPGMFVLAVETYLKKYHNDYSLDWFACSLEGGTALTDIYELYKNNPDRYSPCDVLKEADIKKCIVEQKGKKFRLVTGDIGIYHEDDYEHLQEEKQLDLEWGQMVLSLNLVDKGGIIFLKMYSLVTVETVYLIDTLTQFFEEVYITKLYCTRIFNDESYIVCIKRNDKSISSIPLTRPNLSGYYSKNIELIKSFEYGRLDIKFRMVDLIEKLLKSKADGKKSIYKTQNKFYKEFYNEIAGLYQEFLKVDEIW